jgi:hypothetical protein
LSQRFYLNGAFYFFKISGQFNTAAGSGVGPAKGESAAIPGRWALGSNSVQDGLAFSPADPFFTGCNAAFE